MKLVPELRRKSLTLGPVVAALAAIVIQSTTLRADPVLEIEGIFVNPSPAKDPNLPPHGSDQPKYSGVGTGSFTYHAPRPPGDSIGVLIDSQYREYADSDGHFVQNDDGSTFRWDEELGEDLDSFLHLFTVVEPDQIHNYGSRLSFAGSSSVEVTPGEPFTLGYLTFQNGRTASSGDVSTIDLSLIGSSPDLLTDLDLLLRISIHTTAGSDPVLGADFISFPDYPEFGTFRVFEETTSTVELRGTYNSLHFGGFGQVLDANGFLAPLASVPDGGSTISFLLISSCIIGLGARRQKLKPI